MAILCDLSKLFPVFILLPPIWVRNYMITESVFCLFVCPPAYLRNQMSKFNFTRFLTAVLHVMVSWMTLCFHIMEGKNPESKTTRMFRRVYQVAAPGEKYKVKYTSICIAHFYAKRLKCAQTWITQFYLQITPCLPLLPSRRTSPPSLELVLILPSHGG